MGRRRLRLGWIGLFGEARTHYLPSLTEWEDIELVAICHPDEDRLTQIGNTMGVRKTFSQPGVMLRQVELDAVFITVPPAKALPIVEACIQRRLHVCMTAATLPDLDLLRALSRSVSEAGVRFNVLFPRRHIQLLSDLQSEVLSAGPLTHVNVTLHSSPSSLSPMENAKIDRTEWLAGVDLLRKLGGEINSFSGVVGRYYDNGYPNALAALVHYTSGATGVLLSDRTAGVKRETVELHGRGISAILDLAGDGQIWRADTSIPFVRAQPTTDDGPAPVRIIGGFDAAARKFVDALLHDVDSETELGETIRTIELLRRIEGVVPVHAGDTAAVDAEPLE